MVANCIQHQETKKFYSTTHLWSHLRSQPDLGQHVGTSSILCKIGINVVKHGVDLAFEEWNHR